VTRRNDTTPAAPVARNYDYQLTDIMQPSYTPGVAELDDARAIDVTLIDPNPNQPRHTFDQAALEELAASIRRHGVLQPILVRSAGPRYQIIAGERRWRAAQLAGLEAVPSIVRAISDDAEGEVLALLENVHRQDLDPLDEAHAYHRLLERLRLSKRGLAESLDLNHTRVNNRLLLIENPAIEEAVRVGALGVTVAQELARSEDPVLQQDTLKRATRGERVRVRDVKPSAPQAATAPEPADVEINFHPTTPDVALRPDEDLDRRDQLTTAPPLASTPQPTAGHSPAEGSAAAVDPGQVRLRDLRLIQLREGRDGEPRQLDTADKATVLRILRADLAWLENSDRQVPHD